MYFDRFFLLEPNLKKPYGHVIEFPFTLRDYLEKKGKHVYIVCNKNADRRLLSSFDNLVPFISQGCFEDLADRGFSFAKDLLQLNEKFHFTDRDLIIILTSYTNQTYGIAGFLKSNALRNQPSFCIWFHQLYPPTKDFNQTLDPKFRQKTHENLRKSFQTINDLDNIYIFTTSSKKLREIYSTLSSRRVGSLPLPYSYTPLNRKQSKTHPFTIGFLGDGRYEKGLPVILNYIVSYEDRDNHFILQNIFPRGYSESELTKLNRLQAKVTKEYLNVSFINDPLSTSKYKTLISKLDALLLPYRPQSYNNRISGIFIEAIINGKPIIVSKNTWMAEQVNLLNNGVVFEFDSGSSGLGNAILELKSKYKYFSDKAVKASEKYREIHSPSNFVRSLLDFVN